MSRWLLALAPLLVAAAPADPYAARVAKVLRETPLIDGHNDWAETIVDRGDDRSTTIDLGRLDPKDYDTDIARLRKGGVGGQFWSVYVSANQPEVDQVRETLDRIGLMDRILARYPQVFERATTAADIRRIHRAGRIASLYGVEGGGQIAGSFDVLRGYRRLGAAYLTLTHFRTIAWADSATDVPKHGGLTKFGEEVVRELNRLGMFVDLSHVSEGTMLDALRVTRAPVIFSHSGARAVDAHPRNVSDAVLRLLAKNGGVVMIDYAPSYVSEERRQWEAAKSAEKARTDAIFIGEPDRAKAAQDAWAKANPRPVVTLSQVADHIDHVAKIAGKGAVGLGSDFDGVPDLPVGLEGVETYPALLAEMMRRGWTDAEVAALAGGNVLRAMEAAERTARAMASERPATGTIAQLDGVKP